MFLDDIVGPMSVKEAQDKVKQSQKPGHKPGWALDPKTKAELKRRQDVQQRRGVDEDSWHGGDNSWSSENNEVSSGSNAWASEGVEEHIAMAGLDSGTESPIHGGMNEQRLSVGDPVIVTAPNAYEGKTGEIAEFSPSGKFVIVRLYNGGEHSMHLSDVEYNQYADDEDADEYGEYEHNDFNAIEEAGNLAQQAAIAIAKKKEQGVAEEYNGNVKDTELKNVDPDNHSRGEGEFVKNQLHTMKRVITHLDNAIGRGEDLPDWVQSEIAQAVDKIVGVMDYSISSKEQDIEKHHGGSALMKEDADLSNLTPSEIKGIGMMIRDGHDIPTIIRIFDNKPTAEQIVAIHQQSQGVAEAVDPQRAKAGKVINRCFGKIYDHGDSGLEYLDRNAPVWFDLFNDDQYDGDIDTIVANAPIDLLIKSAQELLSVVSDLPYELDEVKQRLDAKCWAGKHKEGTKIKGGVRVNNCVPNESVQESYWTKLQNERNTKLNSLVDELSESVKKIK